MKNVIVVLIMVFLVNPLYGNPLGGPGDVVKPKVAVPVVVDPERIRQGGDTIEEAFIIESLPFHDSGTTVGYNNNYGQSCPYGIGPSPEVCYLFTPDFDMEITVDLCGSQYDTKTYIYGPNWEEIACNDDYYMGPPCGLYVSRIPSALLEGGLTYLICVDGYWGEAGEYELVVREFAPCDLEYPMGAVPEDEPPLVDGYVDDYNSGCNHSGSPFQELHGDANGNLVFAGVSGWYTRFDQHFKDSDWFIAEIGESGILEFTINTECRSIIADLWPQDCSEEEIVNFFPIEGCQEVSVQFQGSPGSVIWLVFYPWGAVPSASCTENEFDYFLEISGLASGTVTTQRQAWGSLKALYR